LGCAQLERLPIKLLAKRKLCERYHAAFERISGITLFREPPNCKSNYWLQTLILDFDAQEVRDQILEITNKQGIMTRPSWELMSELNHFKSSPRMDLASATSLSSRIINVPSNLVFE
jgi:perosamine synthetase